MRYKHVLLASVLLAPMTIAEAQPTPAEADLEESSNDEKLPSELDKVSVATLGVTTRAPTDEEASRHDLPAGVRTQGQIVVDLEDGGSAANAGISVGDVLLKFGRDGVFSQDDISDYVRGSAPGETVDLEIADAISSTRRTVAATMGTKRTPVADEPQFEWDLAGLEQLKDALAQARDQRKWVLVGLSGAET